MNPEFEFINITKTFGEFVANKNVSFKVMPQTIHGVVGENGAGKSTILKIFYGLYQPDSGEIRLKNNPIKITSPEKAIQLGIGMVHQHFMLVPTLTVWENIILGKEPQKVFLDTTAIIESLTTLQKTFGFNLNLFELIENLSVGQQQQVEILKILYRNASILILDEPTAVLTPQEVDVLFEKLMKLKEQGKTIVLISHKLREILKFTQNVTVLRQGQVIETIATSKLTAESLAEKMVGRHVEKLPDRVKNNQKEEILKLENISLQGEGEHKFLLKDISFSVHRKEVVGIAGIEGNGQQELIEVLSKIKKLSSGKIEYLNKNLDEQSTYDIRQKGFGVIHADRHREGCVLDFSIWENFVFGHHLEEKFRIRNILSFKKIIAQIMPFFGRFEVRPAEPKRKFSSLSGGNQQKVVVARELNNSIQFLLAAHPTRGVDIGAIEKIHQLILKLRDEGSGVLLISSELDEIFSLSDRILVIQNGKIVFETTRENAKELEIGKHMTGGEGHALSH